MYQSAEVRWFFRGALPRDMRRWFDTGGPAVSQPQRTDEYLVLPGCVTTSVKFRDNRFEVKALTQSPSPVSYAHDVSGLRDAWVKWSSAAIDVDDVRLLLVRPEDQWVSVSKSRHLRLVSLEDGEPADVAPGHEGLSAGCQVELTAVRAWPRSGDPSAAVPWWTLSFEAFGPREKMTDGLDRVIGRFLTELPPANLDREASRSYPVWLHDLCSTSLVPDEFSSS